MSGYIANLVISKSASGQLKLVISTIWSSNPCVFACTLVFKRGSFTPIDRGDVRVTMIYLMTLCLYHWARKHHKNFMCSFISYYFITKETRQTQETLQTGIIWICKYLSVLWQVKTKRHCWLKWKEQFLFLLTQRQILYRYNMLYLT